MTKNSKKLILVILILLIIGELIILLNQKSGLGIISNSKLSSYADSVIEKCKNAKFRQSCYDREIPKLMDNISMENAFAVTRIVQNHDKKYAFCHVLGHNLSAREVKKDPSKWKDVLTRCPSGECSNGCLHGGLQEKFRSDSLTDQQIKALMSDFYTLCEPRGSWNPTRLEQGSCYHALGHITMYATRASIDKSLKICDQVALKKEGRDYRQLCYDGVFMQIFQPLEPEDFALIKGKQPKVAKVESYCKEYKGAERSSCLSESWPLFRKEVLDANKVSTFCDMQDKEFIDRCYYQIFYVATSQFNLDWDRVLNYCSNIADKTRRPQCFANSASRMLEVDYANIPKAVNFCKSGDSSDAAERCYEELANFSSYNFGEGSDNFYKLCNDLPDRWKDKCLNNRDI